MADLSRSEALIVGGGLAGSALGILLARQGRAVEILEKSATKRDTVCGEFLSREAVFYLEQLGVDLRGLGAVRIDSMRLFGRGLIVAQALPFAAMSLTRRTLDEALLTHAAIEGAQVLRGQRVESLTHEGDRWTAQLSDGISHYARHAFLACGKHDLHGYARGRGVQNDLVAFKMYFRLSPAQMIALSGCVELILFSGGYAGLMPVENGVANLCLLLTRKKLQKHDGEWIRLLDAICDGSEHLTQRLKGAIALLEKPLALSAIPYGMVRTHAADGLWRLGDQAAVIPSFSGDGMSIALHSAHLAAATYLNGGTAEIFQQRLRREVRPAVQVATALSRLMIAQPALGQMLRFWPPLMRHVVMRTRVPAETMLLSGHVQT